MPAPSVLVFAYQGFTDESFILFIERLWKEHFASQKFPVQIFADTQEQTGYTAGFRTGMFEWSKRMISRSDEYVLLVKSRWVAMGVAIVRSTLGLAARHLQVTTKGEVFRAKLDAAVRRSVRRSG